MTGQADTDLARALGNALTCVLGYLALAQEHGAVADDPRLMRHLERARAQVQRAGALAGRLASCPAQASRRSACSSTSTKWPLPGS